MSALDPDPPDHTPSEPSSITGTGSSRPTSDSLLEKLRPVPLEKLVVELALARACSGEVVAELAIGEHWTMVRRGPAELDAESFCVDRLYIDDNGIPV